MRTEWRLRHVTTDHLPRAVPSQRTEGGQRGKGCHHPCLGEEHVGMEGPLRFRATADTAVVCGPMTGMSGRKEGKKRGKRKEKRRKEGECRRNAAQQ